MYSRKSQPLSALGEGHATIESAAGGEGKFSPCFVARSGARKFLFKSLLPAALLAACGGGAPSTAPVVAAVSEPPNVSFAEEPPGKMLRFHSKRFNVSVPLPDGKKWRIDDHTARELVATHEPTRSMLVVSVFTDAELTSRQVCEQRMRDRKLVPAGDLHTVEEQNVLAPEMFDTRVWVALEPAMRANRPLVGHVMAFGGFLRKCLFFHYSSEVPTAKLEAVLSARLAVARTRILGGLTVDAFAAPPPRERPESRERPPPAAPAAPE